MNITQDLAKVAAGMRNATERMRDATLELERRQAIIDGLRDSLEEILDYRGGADSALQDEYVMDRARRAIEQSKT